MTGVGGKLDARNLLNDVHNVGSIRKVPHYILTSLSDPIPNVFTDEELSEMLAKTIKHHRRIISKIG